MFGRIRTRIFQSWFRVSRPMTLGVRAWVERVDGRVALVRHTYTPGYYFPGGGVERGEPALAALQRELEEEIGAMLTGAVDLVGIYSNHRAFPNDHVLFYRVAPSSWIAGAPTSRGEIAEIIWVEPSAPPPAATRGTRRRFEEMREGASPPADW